MNCKPIEPLPQEDSWKNSAAAYEHFAGLEPERPGKDCEPDWGEPRLTCKECGRTLFETFETDMGMCNVCLLLADRRRVPNRQQVQEEDQ